MDTRRKEVTLERKKAAEERRRLEEEKAKVRPPPLPARPTPPSPGDAARPAVRDVWELELELTSRRRRRWARARPRGCAARPAAPRKSITEPEWEPPRCAQSAQVF